MNNPLDTVVLGGTMHDDTITISDSDLNDTYIYSGSLSTALPTSQPTVNTSGTLGSLLTASTTGNLVWSNPALTATATASPYTVNTGTISAAGWTTYNNQPQVLQVSGDAEFKGEVTIRGVKLDERLTAIEERLAILRPNNDLEGRWEKLKALGEEYRRLEKEILEGESIWDTLKK